MTSSATIARIYVAGLIGMIYGKRYDARGWRGAHVGLPYRATMETSRPTYGSGLIGPPEAVPEGYFYSWLEFFQHWSEDPDSGAWTWPMEDRQQHREEAPHEHGEMIIDMADWPD